MPATGSTAPPHSAAGRTVSAPYMVWIVMSMATPLTVVTGIIVIGYAATGLIGLPAAFLLVGLLMSLFFAAYTKMAPLINNPGSFVGYIAAGLGRIAGVGGAAVAVIAYGILLWGLFGYVGTTAAPLARKAFGWDLPWWAYALLAWALVAWLGHRRVRDAARVVGVLLGLELAAIVVVSVINVLNPAGGVVTTDTLEVTSLLTDGRGALLALAFLGFIGIEAIVTFAKESDNPERTVPLAAFLTILFTTVMYAGSAWALSVATGPDGIVGAAQAHGAPGLVFHLARPYLGNTGIAVLQLLLLTSVLAAMIGFHNAGARYLLALGKEHVLPRVLGDTSPRTGAPVAGSRVQSAATLLVIVIYALIDIDPVRFLFYWAGGAGAIGVMLLMTTTAWSIVVYFIRKARNTPIRWWVVASAAALGMSWVLFEALANFALLLGEAPGPQPTRIILLVFGGTAAIGATWAWWLRLARHDDYLAIGLGGTVPSGPTVTHETPDEVER